MSCSVIYYGYCVAWVVCIFHSGGLHLPLGWFASSACVVCIFRLGLFASSAWGGIPPPFKIPIPTIAPDHTLGDMNVSPGGHECLQKR